MSFFSFLSAFLGFGREAPVAPLAPPRDPALSPWPAQPHEALAPYPAALPPVTVARPPQAPPAAPLVVVVPRPLVTPAILAAIFPRASGLAEWAAALDLSCRRYSITGPRLAHFLAQAGHESAGLTTLVEGLNYSEIGIRATWPTRFSVAQAAAWGRNAAHPADQPAIANRAYANRNGNGNDASGDGWRFRGRGLIQITGRANYTACAEALGMPLDALPAYLETKAGAAEGSAWWWQDHGVNALADAGDFLAVTKRVNGGTNGLDDRRALLEKAEIALA